MVTTVSGPDHRRAGFAELDSRLLGADVTDLDAEAAWARRRRRAAGPASGKGPRRAIASVSSSCFCLSSIGSGFGAGAAPFGHLSSDEGPALQSGPSRRGRPS